MPGVKERQKRQWSAAAAGWDRRFAWYSRAFGPLMRWCCAAADLMPGMRVLDVASGSGQPAFEAAVRVGPGGGVIAIDISPDMVACASRRGRAAGMVNLEFLEMDAEDLRFADDTFDAVTCACGLMFFPDASGALAEIRRVLRPGGRLAVAVWDQPSRCSFMTVAGRSVAQFFPPSSPDPKAPGGFRFSRPGELEALLLDAGFRDVRVESLPMTIDLASAGEYWEAFMDMAAGAREKMASLSDGDRGRLKALVEESCAPYVADGRLRLMATPLGASAVK
jgi:ubiquinone/menaquinone biosynthesis C-methylase UbiE